MTRGRSHQGSGVPDGNPILTVAPYAGTSRTPQPDETGTGICIPVTNSIKALNAKLRRAVRARGHFLHDDAVLELLFLVLNLAAKEWRMPAREWSAAKAQFAILFEDRFAITCSSRSHTKILTLPAVSPST
jgi:putative transposase